MHSPWNRARPRGRCLLSAPAILVAMGAAPPVLAHPDSPSSPPLFPLRVPLKNVKPAEIVALFAREHLPASSGEHFPRAARSDGAESLLPGGIDAVLQFPAQGEVIVVGTEIHPQELRDCIRVLDAPVERTGPERERVTLTLGGADPLQVRDAVLRLPGSGTANGGGRQLTLEGSLDWLHRALRQVIRAELHEPATVGVPNR